MSVPASLPYRATLYTSDVAILHCLRSLAHYSEEYGNKNRSFALATEPRWVRAGHKATFQFSAPDPRAKFLHEAERIMPTRSWQLVSLGDPEHAAHSDGSRE